LDKLKDKLEEKTLELEDSQKRIALMNEELVEAKRDCLVDSVSEEKREFTNDNDNDTDNDTRTLKHNNASDDDVATI
jgi:hypothetical protein